MGQPAPLPELKPWPWRPGQGENGTNCRERQGGRLGLKESPFLGGLCWDKLCECLWASSIPNPEPSAS